MPAIVDDVPDVVMSEFQNVPNKGGFRHAGDIWIKASDGVNALNVDTGLIVSIAGSTLVQELPLRVSLIVT